MKSAIAYFNAKESNTPVSANQVDAVWAALGLAPGKRVLELGAGAGAFLKALADRGADVTGVEAAPRLAERAAERGVKVMAVDARELGAEPTYDGVLLLPGGILGGGEEEDDLAILRAALAALAPGGRLFVAAPHVAKSMADATFCPMACRVTRTTSVNGESFSYRQRVFHRAELVRLIERAGGVARAPARGPLGEPQTQAGHDHVVVVAERGEGLRAAPRETWYADFFSEMKEEYLDYRFTRGTGAETTALIERLGLRPGDHVLDIACGVGRHALELARRGYRVHGIDLSGSMIEVAQRRARELGLEARATFEVLDARSVPATASYDAVYTVCEGAFSLLEDDQQDRRVLEAAFGAAKPGARFVLTALNLLRFLDTDADIDLDTGVSYWSDVPKNQPDKVTHAHNRAYLYPELVSWLRDVGFAVEMPETNYIFGRPLVEASHFELTVTGQKPGRPA
ncbi:MAG: methyltransferase domain-containing protein [Kofleriaceae bacterium]